MFKKEEANTKEYTVKCQDGTTTVLLVEKVTTGDFPDLADLQRFFNNNGDPSSGKCRLPGKAVCTYSSLPKKEVKEEPEGDESGHKEHKPPKGRRSI